MTADKDTLLAYATRAGEYADRFSQDKPGQDLRAFMSELPAGARVLDLGCGPGQAAAFLQRAGFRVDALDASPEMARIARRRFGLKVRVAPFSELDAEDEYDGIFANFSLLHVSRAEFPGQLGRVARALRKRGLLHLGMKTGQGERRDSLGRFYAYYTEAELERHLEKAGFEPLAQRQGIEAGLAGQPEPWIVIRARKTV